MTEETKRKYRETARKWYFANREKNLEKAKKWKRNNQRQVKAYQKKWRIENQEHKRQYQKKWYLANREQESANAKQRSRANPKKAQQIRKKAMEVRKTNPMYRLSDNMSRAIRRKLQSGKEGQSWQKLVGYTYKQLKRHLEKQFLPGMTWDNYGLKGWTIDHKVPVSVFNFTDVKHIDFRRCWALSNLQPLWMCDNLSKKAKLEKPFQPRFAF